MTMDSPPKVHETLSVIAAAWLKTRAAHYADKRIPKNPEELSFFWIGHQSPPNERFDRPVQQPKLDGSGMYWKTPYLDRIRNTLIKFLSLDSGFQSLIIAAAEDKIFWRGDDREFFLSVISEHEKMRKVGVEAYRNEALRKLRAVQGAMTGRLSEDEREAMDERAAIREEA